MILKEEDIGKKFADEEGEELIITAIKGKKVGVSYTRDGYTCDYLMQDIYPHNHAVI